MPPSSLLEAPLPDSPPVIAAPEPARLLPRAALLLLSAAIMSLAFAPAGQFYLAWFGLIPWLLVVRSARSWLRAAMWGWLGCALLLSVNLLYIAPLRILALPALSLYLAGSMGVAAAIIHAARLIHLPPRFTLGAILARAGGIAAIWVTGEWARGNLGCAVPWLYLAHSQLPALPICQLADITGAYGISFCVIFVNALLALAWIRRRDPHARPTIVRALIASGAILLLICLYGAIRLRQQDTYAGPSVLLVQTNQRDRNELVTLDVQQEILRELLVFTTPALRQHKIDLVVWPESVMPALNAEAILLLRHNPSGAFYAQVHRDLLALAASHDCALVTGGNYASGHRTPAGKIAFDEFRNSAYFFSPASPQAQRYDKVRLMPFGETMPFPSRPFLHRLLRLLTPVEQPYVLSTDPRKELTVFTLPMRRDDAARFVSPICYDDLDAPLIRRMLHDTTDLSRKRADFFVQLSDETWFDFGEPAQHLNVTALRCIENRVPAARCVNGGVSAFIDSCGRVSQPQKINTSGVAVQQLQLDRRITIYARICDAFAMTCTMASGVLLIAAIVRRKTQH